jgi:hypothetical protein
VKPLLRAIVRRGVRCGEGGGCGEGGAVR